MTIVTLADERYALPLAVLFRSLSDNLIAQSRANLLVIDGGISAESKLRLRASYSPDRLDVRYVSPHFGGEEQLPVWGRLPALTYARIFVPELVGEGCGKVILLDSDVMLCTDISRLWRLELGDKSLLAVQDPAIPYVSSPGGLACYSDRGLRPDHPHFNAGVMVVNVDKWRRSDVSWKAMQFVRRHAGELNHCDQDALNAVLAEDWGELDPRWQVQPRLSARNARMLPHLSPRQREELRTDPWLIHFSGRLKPWAYRSSNLPDRAFYEYLDRTAWHGWRPEFSWKAGLFRLYDSRLRDWVYPVERWGLGRQRNLSRRTARV